MKMGTTASPWRYDAAARHRASIAKICDGLRFGTTAHLYQYQLRYAAIPDQLHPLVRRSPDY